MNVKVEDFVEAIDKLILLRVQQGEKGYHLSKGTIENAK